VKTLDYVLLVLLVLLAAVAALKPLDNEIVTDFGKTTVTLPAASKSH